MLSIRIQPERYQVRHITETPTGIGKREKLKNTPKIG